MELVIIWIVLVIVTVIVATQKGRSGCGWLLLSVLFGPIVLLVLLVLPSTEKIQKEEAVKKGESENYRKCPYCAEPIRKEAIKCKHCGSEVEPLTSPEKSGENSEGDEANKSTQTYKQKHEQQNPDSDHNDNETNTISSSPVMIGTFILVGFVLLLALVLENPFTGGEDTFYHRPEKKSYSCNVIRTVSDVEQVQKRLSDDFDLSVDGIWGSKTKEALREACGKELVKYYEKHVVGEK